MLTRWPPWSCFSGCAGSSRPGAPRLALCPGRGLPARPPSTPPPAAPPIAPAWPARTPPARPHAGGERAPVCDRLGRARRAGGPTGALVGQACSLLLHLLASHCPFPCRASLSASLPLVSRAPGRQSVLVSGGQNGAKAAVPRVAPRSLQVFAHVVGAQQTPHAREVGDKRRGSGRGRERRGEC